MGILVLVLVQMVGLVMKVVCINPGNENDDLVPADWIACMRADLPKFRFTAQNLRNLSFKTCLHVYIFLTSSLPM
jgi:hypothetical protein